MTQMGGVTQRGGDGWCSPPDHSPPLQVGGEAWVRELCGPSGMIHKVWSALWGVPYLPSLGQLAQCLRVHLHVAVPRVVPGAGPRLSVDVVHLTLRCHPLLCRRDMGGAGEGEGRDGEGKGREGTQDGKGAGEGW